MDDDVSQFRRHAHNARELAKRAQDERERDLLDEVASHWEALAELWPRVNHHRRDRS